MSLRTHLTLGRVSNLPTVWSNVVAGAALGGAGATLGTIISAAIAPTLLYVGGMYLNDAFDARHDGRHRPDRPIPAGLIDRVSVLAIGFALIGAAILWVLVAAIATSARAAAILPALLLAATVVVYDVRHKGSPAGPLLMGTCRGLVYPLAALTAGGWFSPAVAAGAAALFGYVVAVTVIAKRGGSSRTVGGMIAGIAVLDAALCAMTGAYAGGVVCLAACVLTLAWQRRVAGT